jgi:hypothetical protein
LRLIRIVAVGATGVAYKAGADPVTQHPLTAWASEDPENRVGLDRPEAARRAVLTDPVK